jgi:hypothetical protein
VQSDQASKTHGHNIIAARAHEKGQIVESIWNYDDCCTQRTECRLPRHGGHWKPVCGTQIVNAPFEPACR